MNRSHHSGSRPLQVFVFAFSLLLLWGGCARAEIRTLKLPKANEFQVDLSAVVQDIPPVPTVVKEDDHYVFTGLAAWGVDRKYMSTFHVGNIGSPVGPSFYSEKDQLEDRMVVYCDDQFWEDCSFPLRIGKQDGSIGLSPSDPQKTMYLQFRDKKDKNISWCCYGNGDFAVFNNKTRTVATYEGGILKNAEYWYDAGKMSGYYTIRNGGMINGEYCYELSSLTVSSKTQGSYKDNQWDQVTGWKNPEDQMIRKFTATEFPFRIISAAGTPFRVIPPVMSFEKEPVAEDLSAFSRTPDERKLYPTLAAFGFPEFPAYEVDARSKRCHITGLARWGAPEDELTVSLEDSPSYSYVPNIHGIQKVTISYTENYPVLSISLYMENGSFSVYNYRGHYAVSASSPGKMLVEYHYRSGYLSIYSLMNDDLYHFLYEPALALNDSTRAEGILPPFSCYMISYALNASELWYYDHGEWIGETGPCPIDGNRIPPALAYDPE